MKWTLHTTQGIMMITMALVVAALAQAQVPMCWNGTFSEGARARRVIVERRAEGHAVVHLYGRPVRRLELRAAEGERGYATADGTTSLVIAADNSALLETPSAG